jgi:hypothetical protein
MSFEAEQALRPELDQSERLLWSGRPQQGLRLRSGDILMIPFSLMWGGFAFFWEFSVANAKTPFFFKLWGIPFVLMGIYIILGRFFMESYLRGRTYYGVTDRRVIIVNGLTNREVKSLTLPGLSDISLSEKNDRSGSITFGSSNPAYAMRSGRTWPDTSKKMGPSFDLIEDARKVYDVIRNAQQQSAAQR